MGIQQMEKVKKVAIQGVIGSFHEDAAQRFFSDEKIKIIECRTFRKVCQMVDSDEADIAVMAIENAIAGSLLENYGLIRDFHLRIIGEIYLKIQMNLLAMPGVKKCDIKEIHSHPVALKQCAEYIDGTFGEISLDDNFDTAGAAKNIAKNKLMDVACISNERTAQIYGLEILDKGIETNKRNYTRFLILSKHNNQLSEESNKASICFEVGHFYGSLARVLNIFAENEINMTKIQSVPIIGKPDEYTFHVDIEWENNDNYEHAIHKVLKSVTSLTILGEYVRGEKKIYDVI
ncbi:MAG TPA: prephenate dehydratase [Prolixibacteraceae bacterium]|nr:prephenate dehydratase [Prolixibacteraceae bacterium]HPS13220.1 prephenate dehydratase [Prolixibacteraceae bacterium]